MSKLVCIENKTPRVMLRMKDKNVEMIIIGAS
jgi:hypothetical protein